jgi:eukaryotic-like serine/threonine-protein kinase
MANVYLAVSHGQGGVDKLVVLKALLPELSNDADALTMFLDEARLAARLNHANVVQTYEVGVEGDRQVIVMEYLDGQSLSSISKQTELAGRTLSIGMHLRIIINALEGLHYAHDLCDYDGTTLGFVHRDVSPQNIFVTYDGQVKVLDFGIAKAATSSTQTVTGVVKGKIAYMAPEQMIGDAIDRRADIYSVGCMLWTVATGKKLWKDTPDVHIMRRVINAEIPTPQSFNPSCDDELNRIVMKALASDLNQRYGTALELQADLEAYCESFGAPIKQRDIGRYLSSVFADTRAELKSLVDRQLTLVTADSAAREEFSHSTMRRAVAIEEAMGLDTTTGSQQTPAPKKKLSLLLVGVAVLALGIGYLLRPSPRPSASVTPPAQPAPPAQPTKVTIRLSATPAEASLILDGERLPANPTSLTLANDGHEHRLRAEADGYEAADTMFTPTHDDGVDVALRPAAPVAATEQQATHGTAQRGVSSRRFSVAAKASAAAAPAVANKPSCAQPFFIDSDGIKKFRPECR